MTARNSSRSSRVSNSSSAVPDINAMRKLAYFVAASLLAHLAGIYGVQLELPQRAAAPLPLEVQLRPAAPPPPGVARPRLRPHAAPTPAPIVPAPIVTAPSQIAAAPIFEPAPPALV